MFNHLTARRYPSATQLQKIFDFSHDVICSIDIDGKFIDVSAAAFHVFGYQPEELTGKTFLEFVIQEDYDRTNAAVANLMRGIRMVNFENRFHRKDGSVGHISWSAHWDSREKIMFCIARDISEQKAKEALQAAYEQMIKHQNCQLQEMLERITDGFFAMNVNWEINYANSQAEQILGIRREDYLGRNFWECFPEMIDTVYFEEYHKAIRENVPVQFEAFFPPFEMWISINVYPSETGLSVFFRNINDRKQEEARKKAYELKIEQQNQYLLNLLEEMKDGFYSLDSEYHVLHWNSQMEVISGMSKQMVMGQVLNDLLPEELRSIYTPIYQQVIERKQPFHKEFQCPLSHRWLDISAYPTNNGMSVFAKDIHERKTNEEELRKLSLVAKETENAVIIIDPNRKTTWVNAAFTRMTGYTFEEIVGKVPAELLEGKDTDPATKQYIHEQYKKLQPFTVEILNYKKSGEPFWSEMHIQPLFDEKGNVEQFFSIRKDTTERKNMEQQIKRMRERSTAIAIAAQEKERSQVGLELHDNVNQVLTSVKLYQELCLSGVENRDALLRRSATLLQESINEIRSLSRRLSAPTLGHIKLKESVIELVDTIVATNKFIVSLDTAAIEEIDVEEEMHLAIYRILQEHFTNVLRHAEASSVQVTFEQKEKKLLLKVSDDGIGFDLQQKSRGLGIANMKARAESVAGSLEIQSGLGKGCILTGTFPLLPKLVIEE